MKRILIPLVTILSATLTLSCVRDQFDIAMLSDDTPRLVVKGKTVLTYSEDDGQLGFNASRKEFRVSNDTMSDYFVITCPDLPGSERQKIKCNVVWTTGEGKQKRSVVFRVERIEGSTYWLHSSTSSMSAVVKELR